MRVIIYGTGGIGGVVGGHLARVGHDVILIGRFGNVQAINEQGLRLVTPTGAHTLQIPSVTSPKQIEFKPDDVVFLCMKGQNTEEALSELKTCIADIPIFCLQNGVRNEEIAVKYFPRVYGVMVRIGAVYLTDGEVTARRDPPGWLIIGRYPKGTDELVESVARALRDASFMVLNTPDVMPYKWGKLMNNLGNAVGAITDERGSEVGIIVRAAQKELKDLLAEEGILWKSNEEIAGELPETTLPLRGVLNTKAQSSTWQSLARKTGNIETEFLNGEVVRLAKKLGKYAPINEKLLSITLEMSANKEIPGKYTPSQLQQVLGLN